MIDSQYGRKHVGGMAVFADIRCLRVSRIFTNCIRAVMAADAVARDIDVIEIRRQPADRAVAVVAVVAAGDVCWMLAGGGNAVVAGAARTQDLGMVDDYHRREYIGGMAVFTDIRRQGVCRILARCVRAVVTVYAIAGDRRVVEGRRQPASCSVAVVAGIAAGNVCRMFADGSDAIVA